MLLLLHGISPNAEKPFVATAIATVLRLRRVLPIQSLNSGRSRLILLG
ncbi:hypothetical protein PN498_02745 [Oscillatoria sp. CS-180]|nr:hypothetical protein [Oscillatoria sp. CS-180]MDB9524894.1 hypothetical protein [Oscillatoria sp. CS-180]